MTDLVAWLEAELARREALVDQLHSELWWVGTATRIRAYTVEGTEIGDIGIHSEGTTRTVSVTEAIQRGLLAGSPTDTARRIAADRKLLELHQRVILRAGGGASFYETTLVCRSCEPPKQFPETAYPCATVIALAEGYGWTA